MRVFQCALLAAVAVFGFAAVASAADLPVKTPMYTKAPAFVADPWTGWYLGGSAGARYNKDTWTTTSLEIPAAGPVTFTPRDNPHDFNSTSGRFGLYGGYNWRVERMWVVGIEADIAWANNKVTNSGSIPAVTASTSDSTRVKDGWDGGLRARLGYLITPAALLYATGGVTGMQSQASVSCSGGGLTSWCTGSNNATARTDSASKTVAGWTIGAGIEGVVMPNWLLRGEYRYSDYRSYHATLLQGGSGNTGNIDVVDADIKNRTHTILIGLAYKFGQ